MTRCSWCLTADHDETHCPRIAGLKVLSEHGVIDPATAEEVNDVLALRMIGYRTAYFAVLGWLKAEGLTLPDHIAAMNPDQRFENA